LISNLQGWDTNFIEITIKNTKPKNFNGNLCCEIEAVKWLLSLLSCTLATSKSTCNP